MSKDVIIFDVDGTIFKGDLHTLCFLHKFGFKWSSIQIMNLFRILGRHVRFIGRKLEYFPIFFLDSNDIVKSIGVLSNNQEFCNVFLLKRILRYKRYGYRVILVSAAPKKIVEPLGAILGLEFYSSELKFGILFKDILGRKISIYKKIEAEGSRIRTVYTDSSADFFSAAKNIFIKKVFHV